MNYPLISEYIESIKSAEDNFEELSYLRPVLGEDGLPMMTSGNFAVVFKMKDKRDGKLYALKCFTKEQEGREEAYRLIADELEYISSNYLTPIKFYDKELYVNSDVTSNTEFPVVLMDWVEGLTLDKFVEKNIKNLFLLEMLAYQFNKMAAWLITQPFAHGDLKPDNIIIKEDGQLVLVDYDGIYVPAMKGQKARELGSPGFRHPSRTEGIFDEHIDDFSSASIALSLKAISLSPSLYDEYGGKDKLLFSEDDFRDLSNSQCISRLQSLMNDNELCTLYGIFLIAWAKNDLSTVSYRLLNIGKSQKENLDKVLSNFQKGVNCIETGNYELAYSIFSSLAKTRKYIGKEFKGYGNLCGNVIGNNCLGYMYAYGLYVQKDEKKAFLYFKKAADNGMATSIFNLGICYEKGVGVERNQNEANRLYLMASKMDYGLAKNLLTWSSFSDSYTGIGVSDEIAVNTEHFNNIVSKFYLL